LQGLTDARIETAIIDPGKAWQNGTTRPSNGKFRDEYLSVEWFSYSPAGRGHHRAWRKHYNALRPHSSIHYLTRTSSNSAIAPFKRFNPEPFPKIDWSETTH
jgi:putative transposase